MKEIGIIGIMAGAMLFWTEIIIISIICHADNVRPCYRLSCSSLIILILRSFLSFHKCSGEQSSESNNFCLKNIFISVFLRPHGYYSYYSNFFQLLSSFQSFLFLFSSIFSGFIGNFRLTCVCWRVALGILLFALLSRCRGHR